MQSLEEIKRPAEVPDIIELHQNLLQEMTSLSCVPELKKFESQRAEILKSITTDAKYIWQQYPDHRNSLLIYTVGLMNILYEEGLPEAADKLGNVIDQVVASSDPNWLEDKIS